MNTPSPLNRAQRRRARRAGAVAGAGLALGTSLVGLYVGGTRPARAVSFVPTENCFVSTWPQLVDAFDKFNTAPPLPFGGYECSTVTFLADISDSGATTALPTVNVAGGRTLTIDGNSHQLRFTGVGDGMVLASNFGVGYPTPPVAAIAIRELEITGTPYVSGASQPSVEVTGGGGMDLTVDKVWIHHNDTPLANVPAKTALDVFQFGGDVTATITDSEFSNNDGGALEFDFGEGSSGTVSVTDSYFHDNYVWGMGSAIYVGSYGTLSVSGSTFANNESIYGSAVMVNGQDSADTTTIANSTFYGNVSGMANYTGSLLVSGGNLSIDHSTFYLGAVDGGSLREVEFRGDPLTSTFTVTNSVVWGGSQEDLLYDADAPYTPPDDPYDPGYGGYSVGPESVSPMDSGSVLNVSYSAIRSASDGNNPMFVLSGTALVQSGVTAADMTFDDHGGKVLPSSLFADAGPAATTPSIPTILPADDSPLIDAAGTSPSTLDQRGLSRPIGDAGDIGSVETRPEDYVDTVTITVGPETPQTIIYGETPILTPVSSGFADGDDWLTDPTCAVYDAEDNAVTTSPLPVGTYTLKCSGGTLPDGYVADYETTGTLTVVKAKASLTYTGTSGTTSGTSITLSATVSPSLCSSSGISYKVNGVTASAGSFPVVDGEVYEIEVNYDDANCGAPSIYAVVVAGGTAAASSGGGWYNVSGAGKLNVGYSVQVNKSRNGSTQVSGQLVWNSQNGRFRFKGNITSFVKTTSGCASGQVCGRITGTGTLRTRNEAGEWVVVGTNLTYRASVIDAGTSTVCTGGRKSTCTTVVRPDSFGIDIAGSDIVGEQTSVNGWPTTVQLSGSIVVK